MGIEPTFPKPERRPRRVVIEFCQRTQLYRVAFEEEAVEIHIDDLDEAREIAGMMAEPLGVDVVDLTAENGPRGAI